MSEDTKKIKVCSGSKSQVCSSSSSVAHLEREHFTEPQQIACKYCGSTDVMKYGLRNGVQNYICAKCHRKFTAKDTPFHMQTPTEQIGAALNMSYDGMSLSSIARHLEESYKNHVDPSTVYRWIIRYTNKVINVLESLKPSVSDTWVVDETVLKITGDNMWFWDCCQSAKVRHFGTEHIMVRGGVSAP